MNVSFLPPPLTVLISKIGKTPVLVCLGEPFCAVFYQALFNDMGNVHSILLSGEKAGYKIACALAMLVTSGHESTAHYQKENLTQVPRAQTPNCSLLFPLTFISLHTESPWRGHRGAPLAFSPSFSFPVTPQSAQFFYFLL